MHCYQKKMRDNTSFARQLSKHKTKREFPNKIKENLSILWWNWWVDFMATDQVDFMLSNQNVSWWFLLISHSFKLPCWKCFLFLKCEMIWKWMSLFSWFYQSRLQVGSYPISRKNFSCFNFSLQLNIYRKNISCCSTFNTWVSSGNIIQQIAVDLRLADREKKKRRFFSLLRSEENKSNC